MSSIDLDPHAATTEVDNKWGNRLVIGGAAAPYVTSALFLLMLYLLMRGFLPERELWLWEMLSLILACVATVGILSGIFGGIGLAVVRKNPLWLLATIASFFGGAICVWLGGAYLLSGMTC